LLQTGYVKEVSRQVNRLPLAKTAAQPQIGDSAAQKVHRSRGTPVSAYGPLAADLARQVNERLIDFEL
jgi:hypothetical protein